MVLVASKHQNKQFTWHITLLGGGGGGLQHYTRP